MRKLGSLLLGVLLAIGMMGMSVLPVVATGEEDDSTVTATERVALCDDDTVDDETKKAIGCGNKTLCDDPDLDEDLRVAAGCDTNRDSTIMPVIATMLEVVLAIVGIIAVGVMIYGGVTYTISVGDSAKTTKAKNIIMYGLIGLVVAMLAYALVTFISKSLGA